MAYNPYTGEDDTQLNMFGSPITNVGTDFNNQMAYVPGSDKDKFLKNLYEMKSTYGETGAYKQNLQKDWDNYKKTGDPLSLPKQEYSGVKGFASLEDEPYDFSGITRHTAMGDNIMRDFNYDVDPATISGPDYLAQFKRGIPENWLQQKKGITAADAAKNITSPVQDQWRLPDTDWGPVRPTDPLPERGKLDMFLQKFGAPPMTLASDADKLANRNFMAEQGIGRDQQTGRMIGGDFAGMNAPGTSAWGSANFGEMAQDWTDKYGDMAYKTGGRVGILSVF